jgi:hypothetical protein
LYWLDLDAGDVFCKGQVHSAAGWETGSGYG